MQDTVNPQTDVPRDLEPEEGENLYVIALSRTAKRALASPKDQIAFITNRILAGGRNRKWDLESDIKVPWTVGSGYPPHHYSCVLTLTPKLVSDRTEQEFRIIRQVAKKAAERQQWEMELGEGEEDISNDEGNTIKEFVEIEFPEDWKTKFFGHIYQRDEHIDIIFSALNAAKVSRFENRYHVILWGDPACGKTEIAKAFKDMLGEDAVLEYDATSTTAAGAIQDLDERDVMPRVLIVEEIEKTDENSVRWLLALLDHRAEIRKVTARKKIQLDIKLVCIATVNDYEQFEKMLYGALASRFPHHLYCPRPSREILMKILMREVTNVEGNEEWIAPAIKLSEELGITDPRKVTALCLCGGDELLDGSYQVKVKKCQLPSGIAYQFKAAEPTAAVPEKA
jgi:hypothetical protein